MGLFSFNVMSRPTFVFKIPISPPWNSVLQFAACSLYLSPRLPDLFEWTTFLRKEMILISVIMPCLFSGWRNSVQEVSWPARQPRFCLEDPSAFSWKGYFIHVYLPSAFVPAVRMSFSLNRALRSKLPKIGCPSEEDLSSLQHTIQCISLKCFRCLLPVEF